MEASRLAGRLHAALPGQSLPALTPLAEALHRAWSEPQRAYHTLQHLAECLHHFDAVQHLLQQPAAVLLALIFHDAIYDPTRHDNEALSARWAGQALPALGGEPALVARVSELVRATERHQLTDAGPEAADTALLLDIDLSILGSTPGRFAEYEAQIRREYAHVPDPDFAQGRARVMRGFAERSPLYLSAWFDRQLGAAARRNLAVFL